MQPPDDRQPRWLPWAVGAGIAVIAGAIIASAVDGSSSDSSSSAVGSPTSADTPCPAVTIAGAVLPTVVTLSVRNGSASGSGSGEVIRPDGYILTNDHVISAAAGGGSIQVLFDDGHVDPAKIVGRSPELDLAVLKVSDDSKLPTIALGQSESLQIGQPVVALGAPLGLDGTVTSGIVSALGRDVTLPTATGQTTVLPGSIQTDASINPGNSGGALVDCGGNLVGVNTAISTVPNASGQAGGGNVGIGFAIPSDLAITVADRLIETGRFVPAYLGINTAPLPRSVAQRLGSTGGLYVQSVTPRSPAAGGVLRPGDVIIKIDGQQVAGPDSLSLAIAKKQVGDGVTLEYLRNGTSGATTITLARRN
jgi:putative serine protease PepD